MVDFIHKLIKFAIDDTISTLESELSYNPHPNLLENNFELWTIPFGDPNCLILLYTQSYRELLLQLVYTSIEKNNFNDAEKPKLTGRVQQTQ